MTEYRIVDDLEPSEEQSDSQEQSSDKAENRILRQSHDLLGILGFGLYLAWFYLTLACSAAGDVVAYADEVYLVLSFLLGESLASIVIVFVSPHLYKQQIVYSLSAVSCILLVLPSVAGLVSTSEVILLGSWFLSGIGAVILLSVWGFFLSRLPHKQACIYPALSALVSVIIFAIIALGFKEIVAPIACIAIAFLSTFMFFVWGRDVLTESEMLYYENTRPPDSRSLLRSALAMVANSFLIGFSFYVLATAESIGIKGIIICAMLAAAVYKIIDSFIGPYYQVKTIIKIIAPVASICLLLLPFVPEYVRYMLIFAMMFISIVDEIICWTAVAEYMHVYKVQPFANMAFGRFGDIIGLMLGYFSASVIIASSMNASIEPSIFLSLAVIVFICIQAFGFRDNYTPYVEHSAMDEEMDGLEEGDEVTSIDAWRHKVIQFAEHYRLTPRQTDVVFLLIKRYSMNMIERELFISIHTVKSHIYTIYQKAGVHSREELIEKLDQFER